MTTEEAKKAGFRPTRTALMNCWHLTKAGSIENVGVEFDNLSADDFPTREKAREALRKRKMEAAKPSETPAEKDARIKALVDSYKAKGGTITKEQLTDEVREWLKKDSAKFYSCTLDDDRSQVLEYRFDVITWQTSAQMFWNKADAEHAKWLADMQSQTTPITPEQAKGLRITDTVFAIVLQTTTERHIDGIDIPHDIGLGVYFWTREAAQAALDKAKLSRYERQHPYMDDAQYAACVEARDWDGADLRVEELDKAKAPQLPEGVLSVPEGYEFVDPKKEPRKLGPLSKDGWLVCQKGGLWRFDTGDYCGHAIQDLGSNDCLLFGPTYFARPKAKAEAEPLEWCERKDGELIEATDSIWDWLSECWQEPSGRHVGEKLERDDMGCVNFRARYRNPLWLAKHGKVVESHETPVGETQAKEVVTGETQRSTSRPLSDAEFKKLVGRMSLPQLYDALKANGVKLEGIVLEPKKVDEQSILEEAAKCVTGPRRRDYGTPDENFGLISSLWSVQLKHEVTPMQVAMCLILLKVARQSNSPKRDNLVDIAGYAQCASELKGAK